MRTRRSIWSILSIAAAILCGLVTLADHLLEHPALAQLSGALLDGVMILATFALLLGIVNLLTTHGRRLVSPIHRATNQDEGVRAPSRTESLLVLLGLIGMLALGIVTPGSEAVGWLFSYVYYPIQASLAALLAFALVRALFRSYQLRNLDAALLLIASLSMLVLQTPWARLLWPSLPLVGEWVLAVPVMAIMRGLVIGASLGAIATALRILAAVDRPYLGE